MSKVRPADAHDAGCLGVLCPKYAQLMLMMLAVWVLSKVHPADAHDAGFLVVLCRMLMMLAVWGFCVQSTPS